MKLLGATVLVVCIAFAQCLSDELKAQLRGIKDECATESSVPEDVLEKAHQGEFAEDDTLSDFMFCFFKKCGFLNDDGDYQADFIKEKLVEVLGEEVGASMVEKCVGESLGDGKANAIHLAKCYHENAPDHHNFDEEE